jgi:hypothetical protein
MSPASPGAGASGPYFEAWAARPRASAAVSGPRFSLFSEKSCFFQATTAFLVEKIKNQ